MYCDNKIWVGTSGAEKVYIYPKMANRHGLIAGATGTGKTITLKVLAESFSNLGVPVFMADVKGDLAGMCRPGQATDALNSRIEAMNLRESGFHFDTYPTNYWDIYGEGGMPLRTTVSEMGPLLLSRIMNLSDIQTDIMTILFKIADDEGLLLLDIKDLRALISYISENAKDYEYIYGKMSGQSLGAIMRAVIALEAEGGEIFFGEPALSVRDWLCKDYSGKGIIQLLDCRKLILNPTLYSTFLLWLMSELFENLPEVGDVDKPKMVFFFDEAHMLFDSASKTLLEKIGQVVKLIRSKGVGIYFITQNPRDIPDEILAQLGNKVQHALRAYTPAEQKAAKAAAQSFRVNEEFDTYEVLTTLGTGQAIVSVLDEEGIPTVVKKCDILPPQSQMGALDDAVRKDLIESNVLHVRYEQTVDRESAYELLEKRILSETEAARLEKEAADAEKQRQKDQALAEKQRAREEAAALREAQKKEQAKERQKQKMVKSVANSAGGTIGRELGNTIGASIGGKFGKRLGGNVGAALGRGIIGTLFKS